MAPVGMTAGAICLCEEVWMPSSFDGLLDTWVDAWAATAAGVTDCVRTGTRIAPWPLDLGRWTTVANARRPPGWSSPHEIVFEAPLARLRDFSAGPGRGVVPTLVLPPQAGHDSCIVDYSAEQSQMRTIVHAGLTRAFTLDWTAATRETADASIEDYLDVIDRAVDHCGGRVNLIGDCQGGWLATIYAALAPAAHQHADDRRRPDRLPRRRTGDRRGDPLAGAERRPALLRGPGRVGRRRAQGPPHARRASS